MGGVSRLIASIAHRIVVIGSTFAALGAIHSLINLKLIRRPRPTGPVQEKVSVLLPVLNEADRIAPTLQSLLAQENLVDLELIIRDDGSTDQTVELINHLTRNAKFQVNVITNDAPAPTGWVSKSWSCYQMSKVATGSVLVFIDADVSFAPTAIAQGVITMRDHKLDLISPYPKQTAITWSERLVQPLLQWSWLTFLPLRIAERAKNPALSAANGQFILVDAANYHASGGHSANPAAVLDDIALLRTIKNFGGSGVVVDGTDLAKTRMYRNVSELTDGYAKSLWSAVGGKTQSRFLSAFLILSYVIPPLAAVTKSPLRIQRAGAIGYLAAVLSRYLIAKRTKSRTFPDVMTHPLAILGYVGLTELSWYRKLHNKLTWRGKKLP